MSEAKLISILEEAEAGAKVSELVRRRGISAITFYRWRSCRWTASGPAEVRILDDHS
ncbi:MAG TPA: transposase [Planctomycetota bacterium]|nr:transposase [Planctomycetota bacterium]